MLSTRSGGGRGGAGGRVAEAEHLNNHLKSQALLVDFAPLATV